ncbi:transporter, auxin efflux carrier family protein [Entamoeba histolytica HM-1:IMSS-B]|uniref:Auxin efflux carrier family protein, putative n=4 Tax=Entamoeba histolytica TaxID=5759 RepID=C4MAS5_ENTH1|nr:auxin efflux carrier family protein, putative [Entamoeba histolytica HM-1:IMSS]EAL45689.1 auxin efflux carrier family protein, putative [Entamoeba histolytica HM-1:IMSS]EMD44477.1 auxin efflux carrier family protein [Entamoeba histolytica KU27]EMH72215.1 transporter, auxin efflux carrier family protein [Entamoeba histolytica HM-1:IMSS-B]EMS17148.1 auxin efflux carrier family protein [Entamoeba histolytica HM-3:IMSS]|eukprot:XP_651076.1 auxin efflux carrier family protein, putative [Entamoeba histolytica HM-1:IMSS]
MEPLLVIVSTFNAIFKLVVISVAGFLATYTAHFDATVRRGYSTLVFQYFVPAIIFTQTATSVERINTLVDWWYLPISAILINGLAFPSIFFVAKIFKLDRLTTRVFVYAISFGNTMYIPLALVDSITSETTLFGLNGKDRGGAYICTFLLMSTLIYWVFGYSFIQKNQIETENIENNENIVITTTLNNDNLIEETKQSEDVINTFKSVLNDKQPNEEYEMKDEIKNNETKENESINIDNKKSQNSFELSTNGSSKIEEHSIITDSEIDSININQPSSSTNFTYFKSIQQSCRRIIIQLKSICSIVLSYIPLPIKRGIKNLCTPPTIATLLGIILILMYPVRDLLFNDGKLAIIGRSLKYLGSAAVISALFILGGNLSTGPKGGNIKWYVIVIALFVRMVIVPIICIGIHFTLWWYNIIPSDPMYFFVVCIESCTPPALNSAIVVNIVYPKGNEQCSSLLFWAYLTSLLTLSVGMIGTLQLISYKC